MCLGTAGPGVPAMAAHLSETIVRTVRLLAQKREKPKEKRKKEKIHGPENGMLLVAAQP